MRPPPPALVIAIGNGLRGDDGAAAHLLADLGRPDADPAAAAAADTKGLPATALRVVHQLTPELSADLAAARRVLFVDAWLPPQATDPAAIPAERRASGGGRSAGPEPLLRPLAPAEEAGAASGSLKWPLGGSGPFSHQLEPSQLLAITHLLFGTAPAAWELLLPAYQLGHGEGLSAGMRRQLPRARSLLRSWCRGDAAIDPTAAGLGGDAAAGAGGDA